MAPGFQRRRERLWAWRARPSRPAMYAVGVVLVLFLFARFVVPQLGHANAGYDDDYDYGAAGYVPPSSYVPVASCLRGGACIEFLDPNGVALRPVMCRNAGGTVNEAPCSRDGVFGTCDNPGVLRIFVYDAVDAGADVQASCASKGGVWRTGP